MQYEYRTFHAVDLQDFFRNQIQREASEGWRYILHYKCTVNVDLCRYCGQPPAVVVDRYDVVMEREVKELEVSDA